MKQKLSATWAATPTTNRREPLGSEIATGFPCGPADQKLFNEIVYRLSQGEAEIGNVITEAGLTPDENNLFQLLQAIRRHATGTIQVFTASGTFTVPTNVRRVRVKLVGGGGGSGGATAARSAGGGGSGGYAEGNFDVTPGQAITVTIGAAGAGGASGSNGGNGGTTSFGALMSATGGLGGQSGTVTPGGGQGGVGSGGQINLMGGMGTDGSPSTNTYGGNGGVSYFGGGGRAALGFWNESGLAFNTAASGRAPGSGGGSGYGGTNTQGGPGAAGIVIVEY